jgi:hypothetical protein
MLTTEELLALAASLTRPFLKPGEYPALWELLRVAVTRRTKAGRRFLHAEGHLTKELQEAMESWIIESKRKGPRREA